MQKRSIPTRRDIRFIQKSQRQRYFFCLKFLSILPPQEQANFRTFNVAWKIQNGQRYYKNLSPKNIHDEFISSHQTCCEHGSLYFLYYHRHLMTCFTIALNYAQEVLLGGKERLPATLYNSYAKYFDPVFEQYAKIIQFLRKEMGITSTGQLPQVSAHYWNPVDYTENISIPEELQQRTPDVMDKLYYAVNGHYAWNFNFATRWFSNNTAQPRIPVNFDSMGFFSSQLVQYSDAEKKVIYGTLNPRSTVQDEFFGVQNIDQYGIPFIANTASDMNLYKNYKKLKQTGSTIDICTLDQQELNTLFGSKVKNLHWISLKERQMLSISNSMRALTYNRSLPHYQFAYALYKKSNIFIKDYVSTQSLNPDNSMQKAHNTMHNLLQLFMSDSQLSITNPLFFLFHSWIDYMLEVKIRMIRTSNNSKTQYNYTKSYLDTRIKPTSVLDQTVKNGQVFYGEYYIFEWANPLTRFYPQINEPLNKKDVQYAFKTRNFVINDEVQGIRRSDELSSFYSKEFLPANAQRFAYFKNFKNFNFDYNYQIHDIDSNGNRTPIEMKDNIVAIPSYIRDIYNDYGDVWNQNIVQSILPPKLNAYEEDSKEAALKKNLLRQIRIGLGGYATYSSSVKSTEIPIQLKITQKGYKQLNIKPQFKEVLKKGIVVTTASLFSRGVGAELCPNCSDQKQLYLFISQKIAEMDEQFVCQLSRGITKKVFFKQQNKQVVDLNNAKANELFTLSTPRPVFNRLELIQGAMSVDFNIRFKGTEIPSKSKITLTLYSYSIQENKLENIVIRKKQTLDNLEFQFPRVFGIRQGKQQTRYLYRHITGQIVNGDQMCNFAFQITGRYKLITFLVNIEEKMDSQNEGYLDVEITDQYYDFKMENYRVEKVHNL